MTATHNTAYVKWRNGRDEDMLNAVSGPFAESNFLSLAPKFLARAGVVRAISQVGIIARTIRRLSVSLAESSIKPGRA